MPITLWDVSCVAQCLIEFLILSVCDSRILWWSRLIKMHAGIQSPWALLAPSAWYPKMMPSNCRINKSWWFMSWAAMLNSRLLKSLSENNKEHIAHPLAGSRDDEWCDERRINITAGEERWGRWSHHETALRMSDGKENGWKMTLQRQSWAKNRKRRREQSVFCGR